MNGQRIIETAVHQIDTVTKLFYGQKEAEGYQQLESVLISITNAIDVIYKLKEEDESTNKIQQDEFVGTLSEALNAMENRDSILLADILQYDIKEKLEKAL
jgi:hypothetical protein